jgi:hypothetical protein
LARDGRASTHVEILHDSVVPLVGATPCRELGASGGRGAISRRHAACGASTPW